MVHHGQLECLVCIASHQQSHHIANCQLQILQIIFRPPSSAHKSPHSCVGSHRNHLFHTQKNLTIVSIVITCNYYIPIIFPLISPSQDDFPIICHPPHPPHDAPTLQLFPRSSSGRGPPQPGIVGLPLLPHLLGQGAIPSKMGKILHDNSQLGLHHLRAALQDTTGLQPAPVLLHLFIQHALVEIRPAVR